MSKSSDRLTINGRNAYAIMLTTISGFATMGFGMGLLLGDAVAQNPNYKTFALFAALVGPFAGVLGVCNIASELGASRREVTGLNSQLAERSGPKPQPGVPTQHAPG